MVPTTQVRLHKLTDHFRDDGHHEFSIEASDLGLTHWPHIIVLIGDLNQVLDQFVRSRSLTTGAPDDVELMGVEYVSMAWGKGPNDTLTIFND